jgi:hypothetical protein
MSGARIDFISHIAIGGASACEREEKARDADRTAADHRNRGDLRVRLHAAALEEFPHAMRFKRTGFDGRVRRRRCEDPVAEDLEIREAIDVLRHDLRDTEARLAARIDKVDGSVGASEQSLRNEIQDTRGELRPEIHTIRAELRTEMHTIRDELRAEMHTVRDELRTEMHTIRDEVGTDMNGMRDELRAEFRGGLAENRRHTEVLFDSVRDDIRIVAEGVAALSAKIDALNR